MLPARARLCGLLGLATLLGACQAGQAPPPPETTSWSLVEHLDRAIVEQEKSEWVFAQGGAELRGGFELGRVGPLEDGQEAVPIHRRARLDLFLAQPRTRHFALDLLVSGKEAVEVTVGNRDGSFGGMVAPGRGRIEGELGEDTWGRGDASLLFEWRVPGAEQIPPAPGSL